MENRSSKNQLKKNEELSKLIDVQYSTSSIAIGQYFKEERLRAKLSESEAAKSLGIGVEILVDYETGRLQIPFDIIYNIAQLYSSSIEEVLELLLRVSFHDAMPKEKKNQQG